MELQETQNLAIRLQYLTNNIFKELNGNMSFKSANEISGKNQNTVLKIRITKTKTPLRFFINFSRLRVNE